jgi:hypothetical protein
MSDTGFSHQEQSMAPPLISSFTSTAGCTRLSLFDEVLYLMKKYVELGHFDLDRVATRKTFLSRLCLEFPDIKIRVNGCSVSFQIGASSFAEVY